MINFDLTHPQTSDNYATGFVPAIIAANNAAAMFYDSLQTSRTDTPIQYEKRFNRTNGLFDEYNGSGWATLATNYAVLNAANTFAAAGAPIIINSTNNNWQKIQFMDAGSTRGYLGATATLVFAAYNVSAAQMFGVDTSGNGTFANSVSAGPSGATHSGSALFTGNNSWGGTNYHGFMQVTNTYGSTNKYFRLNPTGGLEIINSAYTSVIFGLDDSGNLNTYGGSINGGAGVFSGPVTASGTNSYKLQLTTAGTVNSYVGANATYSFLVTNQAQTMQTFNLDQSGNATFGGGIVTTGIISSGGSINFPTNGTIQANNSSYGMYYRNSVDGSYSHTWTNASGTVLATLSASGVGVATTWTGTSDENLKTNWQNPDYKKLTEFVAGVENYGGFEWLKDGGTSLGIPAQYFEKNETLVRAVHTNEEGIKAFNYGGAAMVTAVANSKYIQELEQRIALLEAA